jgi:hypothetical protein
LTRYLTAAYDPLRDRFFFLRAILMAFFKLSVYAAFFCLLTACGGGGASEDIDNIGDDSNIDGFDPPNDTATPLEYDGINSAALLNATNTAHFLYGALGRTQGAVFARRIADFNATHRSPGFNIAGTSDFGGSAKIAPTFLRPQDFAAVRSKTKNGEKPLRSEGTGGTFSIAAVSDSYDDAWQTSENCESGRIEYYILLNNNGTGLMVVDNRNCLLEGVLIDGMLTYDIHDYNSDFITHATISFNRLTTTVDGVDFVQSGTIEFEDFTDIDLGREVANIVYTVMGSGTMVRMDDMVIETQNHPGGSFSESISGRFYHSQYGHADIETLQTLEYSADNTPIDGELMITGGNGSKARLEYTPETGFAFVVELDADGNDAYEDSASIHLGRLVFEENMDIADDDGDGMHNSWETFYGLDPQNPGDTNVDSDEDFVSNINEYLHGTSPQNDEEIPSYADVTLEWNKNNDEHYPAGQVHILRFEIDNNGPDTVDSVTASITLPPEFDLLSAPAVCDIAGNVVTCEATGLLNDRGIHVPVEVVLPEATGIYSYEAVIVDSSLDRLK